MPKAEGKPFRGLRSHHDDISRTDSIEWCDAYFMEIRPQFAKQEVTGFESGLVARYRSDLTPLGEADAATRHMLKADVRSIVFEFGRPEDRKSTRLNSSHVAISYAVFCLK